MKKLVFLFVVAGALIAMTSCNRGYGCPTNLKTEIVQSLHLAVAKTVAELR